jgi:hypothetical protein
MQSYCNGVTLISRTAANRLSTSVYMRVTLWFNMLLKGYFGYYFQLGILRFHSRAASKSKRTLSLCTSPHTVTLCFPCISVGTSRRDEMRVLYALNESPFNYVFK